MMFFKLIKLKSKFLLNDKLQKEHFYDKEMQLKLMSEQLNPHFLFNSLNVLKSLININSEKAIQYTVDLADLLRISIDHKEKDNFIKNEIELLLLYLSIQNNRFNHNIFYISIFKMK